MEEISAATRIAFYRQHIAENPDVLEYFEQATPVNELVHRAHGFAAGAPQRKPPSWKICERFHGFLVGCKAAMRCLPGLEWAMR